MQMPTPITRDIVLVGGGHAHALVLRMWGMDPVPGVRLTLIDPNPVAAYSGMLPGYVSHYSRDDLEMDLVKLARFAGARLILGRAVGIDRAKRRVMVEGRAPVAYDLLSLDIGVASDMLRGIARLCPAARQTWGGLPGPGRPLPHRRPKPLPPRRWR